jgi:DNA-binding CsgD family transcriptional regulator
MSPKRLTFSHPLVRGGVYHAASAAGRRAAHRALAAGDSGEARAWHLGAAALGPDEDAAAALEAVAGIATARRAYAVAAEALERAAELTADPARAVGRLLGAGAAALSAGRPANALALAEEASERATDPLARAAAQHLRGILTLWSGQILEAMDLLERSADAAAANPPMAALILADASFGCSAAGDCARSLALAERAAAAVGEDSEPAVRAPVLATLAWALILRGETDRARPLMSEVLRLAPSVDPFSPAAQVILMSLNCRVPFEDYEGALADTLERAAAAREAGSLYALPTPLCIAAAAALRLGRWNDVEQMCGEAVAAAEETSQWGLVALARVTRGRVTAARGKEAEARADADAALALSESAGVRCFDTYGRGLLGFLELSAGRIDAAIAELEETERQVAETGLEEPTIVPWAPDLVDAYMRAGRADPARRVLATLVRQADRAGTSGTAALVERCRGMVADDDFDDHFQRAMAHHDASAMPFERGRTLLAWGMRLHRARRRAEARDRLREAAALFDALPAETWAGLARAELRAAGGRRTRQAPDNGLSAQEERVARAAGRGATTREIAAELFLSPKTVEFHLGRAYRKLGIRSRAALSTALSERDQRDDATAPLSN